MDIQRNKFFNKAKNINDIKITAIKSEEPRRERRDSDREEKMEEFLTDGNRQVDNPIFIQTDSQYAPKGLMKILNRLVLFIVIFLVGGIGGVWMDQLVIPKLALKEPFKNYAFLKSINDHTSIINQTNNVIISDDSALLESIRKISPSVVGITANYVFTEKLSAAKLKARIKPKITIENRSLNGVFITSDGLVLTRDPQNFKIDLVKNEFTEVNYTVSFGEKEWTVSGSENITFYDAVNKTVKDTEKGSLVILKIKAENLPVVDFGDSINAEAGQRVVALGNNIFSGIISENGVKGIIRIDNYPSSSYFGSGPLVDTKGKIIGINIIDKNDRAGSSFIGVDEFKDFIKQVIGG